jgi:hypothetical protein
MTTKKPLGWKIQIGRNRQHRLRWTRGPLTGRSVVFASADDAMDALEAAKLINPQARLVPTFVSAPNAQFAPLPPEEAA